jgi:hypothetical protein
VDNTVARFEFRTFAPHMGASEQCVRAQSPCDSISENREIHLLDCENTLENNVKSGNAATMSRAVFRHHPGGTAADGNGDRIWTSSREYPQAMLSVSADEL